MKLTTKQRYALALLFPIFCITLPTLASLLRPVFNMPNDYLGAFLSIVSVSILDLAVIAFTVWGVKGLPTAYAVSSSILMMMEYFATHTAYPWHEVVAAVLFATLIPLATWSFSKVFADEIKRSTESSALAELSASLQQLNTDLITHRERIEFVNSRCEKMDFHIDTIAKTSLDRINQLADIQDTIDAIQDKLNNTQKMAFESQEALIQVSNAKETILRLDTQAAKHERLLTQLSDISTANSRAIVGQKNDAYKQYEDLMNAYEDAMKKHKDTEERTEDTIRRLEERLSKRISRLAGKEGANE